MKEEDGVKLSQTLYARAEKIWPRYLCHPFVTQMAEGTLPPEKFRYYMLQDYLYLKDYVKIFAAIIQKADDFEQIRFLSGELADTIGETFRTHIPYMKRLGITEALKEKLQTIRTEEQETKREELMKNEHRRRSGRTDRPNELGGL